MTDYELFRGGMIQCMFTWENLNWGETPDGFYLYAIQNGVEDQLIFDKDGSLLYHFIDGVDYFGQDTYFYKEEED